MYKALIIDDEKPVQIAIHKLGNWRKYHIQSPDVASNGKKLSPPCVSFTLIYALWIYICQL